jgi:tryptophan synthase alpha chain
MSRIAEVFATASQPRLVAYATAGDPDLDRSAAVMTALACGGADVLEVGVPFSDPIADGPVIQRAAERALAAGTTLEAVCDLVARVRREIATPMVLFTYVNPVLRMGVDAFAARAAKAGADGVLLLDLPIEESEAVHRTLDAHGLDQIFLVSPTTTEARLAAAAKYGRGFLYAISRLGVTGARHTVADTARPLVERVRQATALPVALGFGIANPDHVREVAGFADAAVVGSAIVRTIEEAAAGDGDVAGRVQRFTSWLKGRE